MRINGCWSQDCSAKGARACLASTTVLSSWGGCIGSRTVYSNNPSSQWTNRHTDKFLDNLNSPTNPKYSGQPLNSATPVWPRNCPNAKMLDLTNQQSSVKAVIDSLLTGGDTYIPIGLTWGWNMLTPGEPLKNAWTEAQRTALGGERVIVLMTDGVNTMGPRLYDGNSVAFGNGTHIAPWGTSAAVNDLITRLCTNIKADDIQIFTVLFDVRDEAAQSLLRSCSDGGDGANRFFMAANAQELVDAFDEIGNQLRELKLIR